MGCGVYWQQVHTIETAMSELEKVGFGPGTPAYEALSGKRGGILKTIGTKFPRETYPVLSRLYLSPESVQLWFDAESGWFSEARAKPGAPPIYHHVSDEVAIALLKKEVTPELKKYLMTPDPYIGE